MRLRPLLANREVTELCINRPQEAFVETARRLAAACTAVRGFRVVQPFRKAGRQLHAAARRHDVAAAVGLASRPASACRSSCRRPRRAGCVAIAIRRPADEVWSIDELAQRGIFRAHAPRRCRCWTTTEQELLRLLAAGDYPAFMRLAVAAARTSWCPDPPGPARRPGPKP